MSITKTLAKTNINKQISNLPNTKRHISKFIKEDSYNSTNVNNLQNTNKYTDYNSMKIFGFNRSDLKYDIPNYKNIKYLYSLNYGKFRMPTSFFNNLKKREINFIVNNHKQSMLYEKYFNPNGYKMKITSKFPKLPPIPQYGLLPTNFKLILLRSGKNYARNELKFIINNDMDKIQLKQILIKLYNLDIENIFTAIQPGRVFRDYRSKSRNTYKRIDERKVAVVRLRSTKVPDYFSKIHNVENEGIKETKRLEKIKQQLSSSSEDLKRNDLEEYSQTNKTKRLNVNKALSVVDNNQKKSNKKKRITYKNFDNEWNKDINVNEESDIEDTNSKNNNNKYNESDLKEIIPSERLKLFELKNIKSLEDIREYLNRNI